jgi:hypothetical protein
LRGIQAQCLAEETGSGRGAIRNIIRRLSEPPIRG